MLSKCANPSCTIPFRYLHQGKLFRVDVCDHGAAKQLSVDGWSKKPPWRIEFFWLCDACSAVLTVVYENELGVTTRPLNVRRAVGASL